MKKFSRNQEDLELMSRDLELNSSELHVWNDFYGNASLLKKYSFFRTKYFYSTIEHGIRLDQTIWHVDKNSPLKCALTYSEFRKKLYQNQTTKYVFNIGSIINYVRIKNDIKPSGSIYFLAHSTHYVDVNVEIKEVINKLKLLPDNLRPEYICIYWKDILREKHILFIENGFKVVSAGHMYDSNFLYRLKEILLNFSVMITSEIGSHVFHAQNCGLKVLAPKNLADCFKSDKYTLDDFMEKEIEKSEHSDSMKDFAINDNFFIELFNKDDFFSVELKLFFSNYFCSTKKLSRLNFTLIHLFSLCVYKIRPKGLILHFFDFIYVRLDRRISKS